MVAARATRSVRVVEQDKAAITAVAAYVAARDEAKRLEAQMAQLKAVIEAALGDESSAVFGNHIVTRHHVPALPDGPAVTVSRAMVGQVIAGKRGRAGYTQLLVQ